MNETFDITSALDRISVPRDVAIDRIGNLFLVHADRPSTVARDARLRRISSELDATRCEHCRDLVERPRLLVFSSGGPERFHALGDPRDRQAYRQIA